MVGRGRWSGAFRPHTTTYGTTTWRQQLRSPRSDAMAMICRWWWSLTKMGFVFVLDRATGRPVFPVVGDARFLQATFGRAGFPYAADPLGSAAFESRSASVPTMPGVSPSSDRLPVPAADRTIARSDGLLHAAEPARHCHFPLLWRWRELGRLGADFDQEDQLFVVNAMSIAHVVRLIPRAGYAAAPGRRTEGRDRTCPWHALRCRADAAHLDLRHSLQRAALGHTHGR